MYNISYYKTGLLGYVKGDQEAGSTAGWRTGLCSPSSILRYPWISNTLPKAKDRRSSQPVWSALIKVHYLLLMFLQKQCQLSKLFLYRNLYKFTCLCTFSSNSDDVVFIGALQWR